MKSTKPLNRRVQKAIDKGVKDKFDFSKEELELIRKIREFNDTKVPKELVDLYSDLDTTQQQYDLLKRNVLINMQKIYEFQLEIRRKNVQLKGVIYETLSGYPDVKVTKDELYSDITNFNLQIEGSLDSLKKNLINMMQYVGVLRVDRKEIVTMSNYRTFVKELNNNLIKLKPTLKLI